MEIKAKCKFNFDSIKALTHLSLFKKANPKKQFITISIILAFATLMLIFSMLLSSEVMPLMLIWTAFIFLCWCYIYFFLPKIRYKALAKMQDAENEYIFYDNVLRVSTKSKEFNSSAEIEYSLFVRSYETSKFFFLYQTNNQVFIIDKSTIEGGTTEDIRNKLMDFIKDKYIICNY